MKKIVWLLFVLFVFNVIKAQNSNEFKMVPQVFHNGISKVFYSKTGEHFITFGKTSLKLWQSNGILLKTISIGSYSFVNDMKATDDLSKVVIVENKEVHIVDVETGNLSTIEVKFDWNSNKYKEYIGDWHEATSAVIAGDRVYVCGQNTQKLGHAVATKMHSLPVMEYSLDGKIKKQHREFWGRMVLKDNQNNLYFIDEDEITKWNYKSKTIVSKIKLQDLGITSLTNDQILKNNKTFKLILGFDVSKNGKLITVVDYKNQLSIWNNGSISKIPTKGINRAWICPKSLNILTAKRGSIYNEELGYIQKRDVKGKILKSHNFKMTRPIYSLDINPQSEEILMAHGNNSLTFWTNDLFEVRAISKYVFPITNPDMSHKGEKLIISSGNNDAQLWDLYAGNFDGYLTYKQEEMLSIKAKLLEYNRKVAYNKRKRNPNSIAYVAFEDETNNFTMYWTYDTTHIVYSPNYKPLKTIKTPYETSYKPYNNLYPKSVANKGFNWMKHKNWNPRSLSSGGRISARVLFNDHYFIGFVKEGKGKKEVVSGFLKELPKRFGSLSMWDSTGTITRVLDKKVDSNIKKIIVSGDNSRMAVLNENQTIDIWDTKTWKIIVTLYAVKDEWVIYTPDGYFDGSTHCQNLVGVIQGKKGYSIEQFAIHMNRPDIILKRLGCTNQNLIDFYHTKYTRRIAKLENKNTEYALSTKEMPITELVSNTRNDATMTLNIKLKASQSSYSSLKSYNLFLNNVPVFGAEGKSISGNSKSVTENIQLISGINKIEVACTNSYGIESPRVLLYEGVENQVKGDLYFIGFGVANYQNPEYNLDYSDDDVRDLESTFKNMQSQYDNIITKTFIDEQVTIDNVKNAKEILQNAKPNDTFILFVAGHGIHSTGEHPEYYYLTHGAKLDNLEGTCVAFKDIENLLQGIQPKKKLFIMDTCESGELEEGEGEYEKPQVNLLASSRGFKTKAKPCDNTANNSGSSKKEKRGFKGTNPCNKIDKKVLYQQNRFIFNDVFRRSGAVVFSSSKGSEYSYESEKFKNGFFTESIINGLTGKADSDKDGKVSLEELKTYVKKDVSKNSGGAQNPTVDRDNLFLKLSFKYNK